MINGLKAVGKFVGLFAAVTVFAGVTDGIVRYIFGPPPAEKAAVQFQEHATSILKTVLTLVIFVSIVAFAFMLVGFGWI